MSKSKKQCIHNISCPECRGKGCKECTKGVELNEL